MRYVRNSNPEEGTLSLLEETLLQTFYLRGAVKYKNKLAKRLLIATLNQLGANEKDFEGLAKM